MLVMRSVVSLVNEKKDHLPSVKAGKEGLTYSFECQSECGGGGGSGGGGAVAGVGVSGGADVGDDGGWGLASMMKKVFKEGPPLLIPK